MDKVLKNFNSSQWLERNALGDSSCNGSTWGERLRNLEALRGKVNGKGTLMHFVQIKMPKK